MIVESVQGVARVLFKIVGNGGNGGNEGSKTRVPGMQSQRKKE